ncbi:hypothetical protein PsYK624_128610 [Phanerochaete sordida]|uniref:Uncharacterized protein n=1 Tax=Phanerochaete sordida TaxID=48140 RepID=A0A9P3GNH4_9APHY|nr:hypothetical protein PsYK624_128610 [Phanerochaete sordida]
MESASISGYASNSVLASTTTDSEGIRTTIVVFTPSASAPAAVSTNSDGVIATVLVTARPNPANPTPSQPSPTSAHRSPDSAIVPAVASIAACLGVLAALLLVVWWRGTLRRNRYLEDPSADFAPVRCAEPGTDEPQTVPARMLLGATKPARRRAAPPPSAYASTDATYAASLCDERTSAAPPPRAKLGPRARPPPMAHLTQRSAQPRPSSAHSIEAGGLRGGAGQGAPHHAAQTDACMPGVRLAEDGGVRLAGAGAASIASTARTPSPASTLPPPYAEHM